MKQFASEAELAAVVVSELEHDGWDVYQEVTCDMGRLDILAVRPGILWAIETKLSLSLDVIGQAWERRSCHLRSVAVPRPKKHLRFSHLPRFTTVVCKRFGIGVLLVSSVNRPWDSPLHEELRPEFNRPPFHGARDLRAALRPELKTFKAAGTKGGGHWTPWKDSMQKVQAFVQAHPGCTLKEIKDALGQMHYSRPEGLMNGIRAALERGWIPWCRSEEKPGGLRLFVKESEKCLG